MNSPAERLFLGHLANPVDNFWLCDAKRNSVVKLCCDFRLVAKLLIRLRHTRLFGLDSGFVVL